MFLMPHVYEKYLILIPPPLSKVSPLLPITHTETLSYIVNAVLETINEIYELQNRLSCQVLTGYFKGPQSNISSGRGGG